MADGKELLGAASSHAKDQSAASPGHRKGYYAASPGAEDLIGWHVNRGFDARARLLPRLHLRARLQPAGHREGRAGRLAQGHGRA